MFKFLLERLLPFLAPPSPQAPTSFQTSKTLPKKPCEPAPLMPLPPDPPYLLLTLADHLLVRGVCALVDIKPFDKRRRYIIAPSGRQENFSQLHDSSLAAFLHPGPAALLMRISGTQEKYHRAFWLVNSFRQSGRDFARNQCGSKPNKQFKTETYGNPPLRRKQVLFLIFFLVPRYWPFCLLRCTSA